jgi:hypothetical protein
MVKIVFTPDAVPPLPVFSESIHSVSNYKDSHKMIGQATMSDSKAKSILSVHGFLLARRQSLRFWLYRMYEGLQASERRNQASNRALSGFDRQ